jgi:hypothetical protein
VKGSLSMDVKVRGQIISRIEPMIRVHQECLEWVLKDN